MREILPEASDWAVTVEVDLSHLRRVICVSFHIVGCCGCCGCLASFFHEVSRPSISLELGTTSGWLGSCDALSCSPCQDREILSHLPRNSLDSESASIIDRQYFDLSPVVQTILQSSIFGHELPLHSNFSVIIQFLGLCSHDFHNKVCSSFPMIHIN